MRGWASLPTAAPGQWVELEGWLAPLEAPPSPGYGLLVPQPECCLGCPPNPAHTVEVMAAAALPAPSGGAIRIAGRWAPLRIAEMPAVRGRLRAPMKQSDRAIDWRHDLMEVHYPGLDRWVMPLIEERLNRPAKPLRAYVSLLDVLDEPITL